MGSGLDVRFRLQPVEKDLDWLPDAADMRGRGVLGHQSVVFLPLARRNERDISLALQMCFPICVNVGAVYIKTSVRDRRAVQHIAMRRLDAGELLLEQDLRQRGKGFFQPVDR